MRRKVSLKIIPVILLLLVFFISEAQKKNYIMYNVKAGETFASIAARYNISARKLADYNNLDYYEGELLSKNLRIPLKTKDEPKKGAGSKGDIVTSTVPGVADTSARNTENTEAENTTSPGATGTTTREPNQSSSTDTVSKADSETHTQMNASTKTKSVRLREMLPWIIFLTASVLLLVVGILFYKAATRKH